MNPFRHIIDFRTSLDVVTRVRLNKIYLCSLALLVVSALLPCRADVLLKYEMNQVDPDIEDANAVDGGALQAHKELLRAVCSPALSPTSSAIARSFSWYSMAFWNWPSAW